MKNTLENAKKFIEDLDILEELSDYKEELASYCIKYAKSLEEIPKYDIRQDLFYLGGKLLEKLILNLDLDPLKEVNAILDTIEKDNDKVFFLGHLCSLINSNIIAPQRKYLEYYKEETLDKRVIEISKVIVPLIEPLRK